MPASSHDRNSGAGAVSTAGIAIVWLVFYLVILVGSFGSGETRRVSTAYAYLPASRVGPSPAVPSAELASGAIVVPAPRHD